MVRINRQITIDSANSRLARPIYYHRTKPRLVRPGIGMIGELSAEQKKSRLENRKTDMDYLLVQYRAGTLTQDAIIAQLNQKRVELEGFKVDRQQIANFYNLYTTKINEIARSRQEPLINPDPIPNPFANIEINWFLVAGVLAIGGIALFAYSRRQRIKAKVGGYYSRAKEGSL